MLFFHKSLLFLLCGTTQLLFFRWASRAPSLPMGSTFFPIHRLLQCFGRSRAAIAALFCHQHSIFCVNLQGKPWFCTNVPRFQQKISSIFIQHNWASAPARSSVFLSLFVPLSGKCPHPVGGRRSHPFRLFKQLPLLFLLL